MIHYKQLVFNAIQVNTWVVYTDQGDGVIFDPGCQDADEEKQLTSFLEKKCITLQAVVATHGHFDHIPAVRFVMDQFNCRFYGHQADQILVDHATEQGSLFGFDFKKPPPTFDVLLDDGHQLKLNNLEFNVLHVPGHSQGSLAFHLPTAKLVIVGDVLFQGSIGRTDLPGGDYSTLIRSIREKLLTLPDDTTVLSGHGPETTIGAERMSNPFL